MSLQVELLEQSFNYIKPYGNQFVSSFYKNLFKANPETKSLFADIAPEIPKNQLWDSLVLVVENLRQPDTLNDVLQGLGARLFTYGALPEHYPLVRDAFFATFEQFLGSEWTSELKQAWLDAYVTFSGMMLDGADCAQKQMAQKQMAHQTHFSESDNNIPTTATATTVKADHAQKQMAHQTHLSESDNNIPTTATTTTVKSVASEKTYEPESQSRKSKKRLLIGGSVAGVIGILLLLILLY